MMTPEQIEALPNPPFRPARDMMLCERSNKTPEGIFFTDESADKIQVCRVLSVGPGLVLDSMEVKPCPYKRGARLFVSPQDGYPITFGDEKYWLFEVAEIMGELMDETSMPFGRDVC